MIDIAVVKGGLVFFSIPIIGQATTQDPSVWADWRTWVGAAGVVLVAQADKLFTAIRGRWERRSLTQEQLEAKEAQVKHAREDKMQARIDELVSAAMADRDAEITRLRAELLKAQVAREEYRDMALGLSKGGEQAREARRCLASREMYRTHPGAREVDEETLEEWSGAEEDL